MTKFNRTCTAVETVTSERVRCSLKRRHKAAHYALAARMEVWWPNPPCTCETYGNGVVSGNDGRLAPAEGCARHGGGG